MGVTFAKVIGYWIIKRLLDSKNLLRNQFHRPQKIIAFYFNEFEFDSDWVSSIYSPSC